jgi:hypothetical protein
MYKLIRPERAVCRVVRIRRSASSRCIAAPARCPHRTPLKLAQTPSEGSRWDAEVAQMLPALCLCGWQAGRLALTGFDPRRERRERRERERHTLQPPANPAMQCVRLSRHVGDRPCSITHTEGTDLSLLRCRRACLEPCWQMCQAPATYFCFKYGSQKRCPVECANGWNKVGGQPHGGNRESLCCAAVHEPPPVTCRKLLDPAWPKTRGTPAR